MANMKLDSIIQIDGTSYEVTAVDAEKLGGIAADNYAKQSDLFSKNYNDLTNKPTIPTDTNQKVKTGTVTFGANDVVEFKAGSNVTITGDATAKTITISSTGGGSGGNSDYAEQAGYADSAGTAASAEYAEYTNRVQVNMEHVAPYAAITISSEEPSDGNIGDIWFKY